MAAKRPADRLSVSGVPASSSPALQSLRLSTLNPRQRYARCASSSSAACRTSYIICANLPALSI